MKGISNTLHENYISSSTVKHDGLSTTLKKILSASFRGRWMCEKHW